MNAEPKNALRTKELNGKKFLAELDHEGRETISVFYHPGDARNVANDLMQSFGVPAEVVKAGGRHLIVIK